MDALVVIQLQYGPHCVALAAVGTASFKPIGTDTRLDISGLRAREITLLDRDGLSAIDFSASMTTETGISLVVAVGVATEGDHKAERLVEGVAL